MLPQDLIDQLNAAETKLQAATALDATHTVAVNALAAAQAGETKAAADALSAHQDASSASAAAIAALKAHFGLPS